MAELSGSGNLLHKTGSQPCEEFKFHERICRDSLKEC